MKIGNVWKSGISLNYKSILNQILTSRLLNVVGSSDIERFASLLVRWLWLRISLMGSLWPQIRQIHSLIYELLQCISVSLCLQTWLYIMNMCCDQSWTVNLSLFIWIAKHLFTDVLLREYFWLIVYRVIVIVYEVRMWMSLLFVKCLSLWPTAPGN